MKQFLLPLVFEAAFLAVPVAQADPVTFTMVLNGPREAPVKPQVQSVPEPGSLALLALGMIGVAFASKGKSKGAGTVASVG